MEKIGPLVGDGAHQQAAGAAALNGKFFRGCVASCNQLFGRYDEVAKGVLLLLHAAGIVPRLPKFAATANVGNGEDHAAIQEAQTI